MAPNRIDILTRITGVAFEDAWANRMEIHLGNHMIPVLGRQELILNKQRAARPKDLVDVQALQGDSAGPGSKS